MKVQRDRPDLLTEERLKLDALCLCSSAWAESWNQEVRGNRITIFWGNNIARSYYALTKFDFYAMIYFPVFSLFEEVVIKVCQKFSAAGYSFMTCLLDIIWNCFPIFSRSEDRRLET